MMALLTGSYERGQALVCEGESAGSLAPAASGEPNVMGNQAQAPTP
jgi:hypothetical protein